MSYWPDPLSQWISPKLNSATLTNEWRAMFASIRQETHDVIRHAPKNTLLFSHWNIPHPPFVFHADGSPSTGKYEDIPGAYMEQVLLVDKVIGEITEELKSAGKFDDAMIVLTTDHSWQGDPDTTTRSIDGWMYHVPLVIKMPGQVVSKRLDRPYSLIQLQGLIEAAMNGASGSDIDRIFKALPVIPVHKERTYKKIAGASLE